ncbi:MAG: hypothetical protein RM338_23300 [Nostoc sp. DedQUE12a]|nr:hypothetical protein [Nostoc sp. DedQUE12a]
MPLDLGKGIFNLNYRSKRSPQQKASDRIEFIMLCSALKAVHSRGWGLGTGDWGLRRVFWYPVPNT